MLEQALTKINTNWKSILENILIDFKELDKILIKEKEDFDKLAEIYPPTNLIFNTFNFFNIEDLKIVIIGQDPYHQPGQANCLCFSVENGIKIPPSLQNIFKEMYNDLEKEYIKPKSGDLTYLSEQGILLLNNTLTVRQSKPNSHLKYWKGFSNKVIDHILNNKEGVIFLLWGNNAKNILKNKDTSKHHILEANHPSPLSANRGGWFNKGHFSKCNKILRDKDKEEIKWIND